MIMPSLIFFRIYPDEEKTWVVEEVGEGMNMSIMTSNMWETCRTKRNWTVLCVCPHITSYLQRGKDIEVSSRENPELGSFKTRPESNDQSEELREIEQFVTTYILFMFRSGRATPGSCLFSIHILCGRVNFFTVVVTQRCNGQAPGKSEAEIMLEDHMDHLIAISVLEQGINKPFLRSYQSLRF